MEQIVTWFCMEQIVPSMRIIFAWWLQINVIIKISDFLHSIYIFKCVFSQTPADYIVRAVWNINFFFFTKSRTSHKYTIYSILGYIRPVNIHYQIKVSGYFLQLLVKHAPKLFTDSVNMHKNYMVTVYLTVF